MYLHRLIKVELFAPMSNIMKVSLKIRILPSEIIFIVCFWCCPTIPLIIHSYFLHHAQAHPSLSDERNKATKTGIMHTKFYVYIRRNLFTDTQPNLCSIQIRMPRILQSSWMIQIGICFLNLICIVNSRIVTIQKLPQVLAVL